MQQTSGREERIFRGNSWHNYFTSCEGNFLNLKTSPSASNSLQYQKTLATDANPSFRMLLQGETLAEAPYVELEMMENSTVKMTGIWGEVWHDYIEVKNSQLKERVIANYVHVIFI